MNYILQIETATKNCSVAISLNGKTIASQEIAEDGYTHAENLHVFINEVIQQAEITFKELKAVAVSAGPGSYTGLRIGVSAAKGLCYTLNIPLIAINTLEVLAQQIAVPEGNIIIPMIDARRMEVYCAIFDSNHQLLRETQAEILTENSFSEFTETCHFIGDSNTKAKEVLTKENFVFVDTMVYPSAKDMSALAFQKYEEKAFEDVAYYEPFYLKSFVITTKN